MIKATFKQAIERALQHEDVKLLSVNQNMIEIALATKKKPSFVKTAITDDLARNLMRRKSVAFILHIDGDVMNEIVSNLETESIEEKSVEGD